MTKPIQVKNLTLGEGMPKICVPLTGSTKEEILEEARAAVLAGADLVEWRADCFEQLCNRCETESVLNALSECLNSIPLLFTIRTRKEGGNAELSTEEYINCNLAAAETERADFIDVEVFGDEVKKESLIQKLHEAHAVVIASSHDFEKTDSREALLERFKAMDRTGADILKMAVMPKEFDDVAAIMQVTDNMANNFTDKPLISMAMGELGAMSRIAGENFGSCLTFGITGKASAPGQMPVRDLRMMMEALHEKNK